MGAMSALGLAMALVLTGGCSGKAELADPAGPTQRRRVSSSLGRSGGVSGRAFAVLGVTLIAACTANRCNGGATLPPPVKPREGDDDAK